jgi:hypothetical protein
MAQGSIWYTHRKGDWSRPIQYHDSPWWLSDDQASGLADFVPGAGDTVVVRHALTVDVDTTIGLSLQAAIWTPLEVSTTGGDTVTQLATGTYTLSATVISDIGETTVGGTVSAPFTLTHGVSKPRVMFPQGPPTACSYNIYLDTPDHPEARNLYSSEITGTSDSTYSDLVSDTWLVEGVPGAYAESTAPPPSGLAGAVTISSGGSLIVADGKELRLRGDVVVESPEGSTKTFITVGVGATYRIDGSTASDPTRTGYRMWFEGGGKVHFAG